MGDGGIDVPCFVSTHSRLKAAGSTSKPSKIYLPSFNTQPPEGGWGLLAYWLMMVCCFNTQPPEGGWVNKPRFKVGSCKFQHTAA